MLVYAGFFFRMRDHAFFFGSGFLLFEFDVLGVLGIVLSRMIFFGGTQSRCFRYGICFGKSALLGITGREFILGVGNVFGDGGGFIVGQLRVSVIFVMLRFEGYRSFVRIERSRLKEVSGSSICMSGDGTESTSGPVGTNGESGAKRTASGTGASSSGRASASTGSGGRC